MTGSPTRRKLLRIAPAAGFALLVSGFAWAGWLAELGPVQAAMAGAGALLCLLAFAGPARTGWRSAAGSVLYTLICGGCAAILYVLAARHERQWDLTAKGRHSLSDATASFLKLLDREVEIVVFDVTDQPYRDLLDRYARVTPRIRWSLRDPRRDPLFTRSFGADGVNEAVFVTSGDRRRRIPRDELDEPGLTNAIVDVTRNVRTKIYFVEGHGELPSRKPLPPADGSPAPKNAETAGATLREWLAERGIESAELSPADRGFIPRDAAALVVAGPKRDFFPAEIQWFEEFLDSGGGLLLMLDLPPNTSETRELPELLSMLRRRGLDDRGEVVVDLQGKRLLGHPLKVAVLSFNENHPVTKPLAEASQPLVLSMVRRFHPSEPLPKQIEIAPLLGSSPEAWSEEFSKLGTSGVAAPGKLEPQPLAWAAQGPAPDGRRRGAWRMTVFGSAEPARDSYAASNQTATALLVSAAEWLTETADGVQVAPPIVEGTPLILSERQRRLILILLVLAFPALVFFGGTAYARTRLRN